MTSAGGNLNATLMINGDAAGAVSATASASDGLKLLQDSMAATGASGSDLTALLSTLADALGAASAAASDMAVALGADADASDMATTASAETTAALVDQASATDTATFSMSGLTGALTGFLDPIAGAVEQAGAFVAAIAAFSIIQDAISEVQQLSDELYNLEVQTERNTYSWQYLFSTPSGPSVSNAQNLAQWSSQFSQQIPFTRQDLMSGITMLGSAQLNTQQVEQFMPFLADITATYGAAHGTTLQRGSQAVFNAMNGMARMLKMDLGINPEDLIQYGLQATGSGMGLHITNPSSLIPALETWAVAHHISNFGANGQDVNGAAASTVQNTYWGAMSSAQDQLQNFLLQMGGTNLNGTIRQGSFFGQLKNDLFGLLDWAGTHQDQLTTFADTLSNLVGTVVNASGGLLGEFFNWLGQMAGMGNIIDQINGLTNNLANFFGLEANPAGGATATSHGGVGGSGGAGGRAAPGAQLHAASQPKTWQQNLGDWMQNSLPNVPVLGGIANLAEQLGGGISSGFQAFVKWLGTINWGPMESGLAMLGKGLTALFGAIGNMNGAGMGTVLAEIGPPLSVLLNLMAVGAGDLLKGFGDDFYFMAQAINEGMKLVQPGINEIQNFGNVMRQLADDLNHGNWGQLGKDLHDFFGVSLPGGSSLGGLIAPGAFKAFGALGGF